MVDGQVRPLGLANDAICGAFADIPREMFTEGPSRGIAHCDTSVPAGEGRLMIAPHLLARLIDAARLSPTSSVLDVGCASGYSTAVIARVAGTAIGIEENAVLAGAASRNLDRLEIDNAAVLHAPPAGGCLAEAPFDAIIISGGEISSLPQDLAGQLAPGGRLACVMNGLLTVATRQDDTFPENTAGHAEAPHFPLSQT